MHYYPVAGDLKFTPQNTKQTIEIDQIVDEDSWEKHVSFNVTLTAADNPKLRVSNPACRVDIVDKNTAGCLGVARRVLV